MHGQFNIESKRVTKITDVLVNAFQLEEEKLLFVMKQSVIISNQYLSQISTVDNDKFLSKLRCFTTDFTCDGKHFLQGFMAEESLLISKGMLEPLEVKEDETEEQKSAKVDEMISVVMRTTFSSKRDVLMTEKGAIESAIILRKEYVNSCLEFAPNQLIIATRSSLHVYDGLQCTRLISSHSMSSNTYMHSGIDSAMGYFWVLPGFHPEHFPFIAISGTKSIDLINLKSDECIPLVITE